MKLIKGAQDIEKSISCEPGIEPETDCLGCLKNENLLFYRRPCRSCPGRLRVRGGQYAFSQEQGYGIASLLLLRKDVPEAVASTANGSVLVIYQPVRRVTALSCETRISRSEELKAGVQSWAERLADAIVPFNFLGGSGTALKFTGFGNFSMIAEKILPYLELLLMNIKYMDNALRDLSAADTVITIITVCHVKDFLEFI